MCNFIVFCFQSRKIGEFFSLRRRRIPCGGVLGSVCPPSSSPTPGSTTSLASPMQLARKYGEAKAPSFPAPAIPYILHWEMHNFRSCIKCIQEHLCRKIWGGGKKGGTTPQSRKSKFPHPFFFPGFESQMACFHFPPLPPPPYVEMEK